MAEHASLPPIQEIYSSEISTLFATDSYSAFKIHDALLRTVAPSLMEMCSSERKAHFTGGVSKSTLAAFVDWAYRGDYPDTQPSEYTTGTGHSCVLQWHLTMYVFSEHYGIHGLQDLAHQKLSINLLKGEYQDDVMIDFLGQSFNDLEESDPLLLQLASFASANLEQLERCDRFAQLLGCAGGAFARHLFRCVKNGVRCGTCLLRGMQLPEGGVGFDHSLH
ncbi:MAG: hypothetical protein M1840_005146 [Geoglossum simile]|nr:MAG: hypothetical protein M1840_005146 [Geoglossum simile]